MTRNKPLLVGICNEKWAIESNHLHRWIRYAKRNSGCRIGVILITDNQQLVDEVGSEVDIGCYFDMTNDHRDFYNSVRMKAPELFGEPCLYADVDADIWGDLSHLMDTSAEISAVASPGRHEDWERIGEGQCYNNGFLVLNYGIARATEIHDLYKHWHTVAKNDGCHPRTLGMMAFNLLAHSGQVEFAEMPYSTSVVWWDDMAMRDAKTVQWCNDRGQAKRLMLEEEWYRGGEEL